MRRLTPDEKQVLANDLLARFPKKLQMSVLEDRAFREKFGFEVEATLSVGAFSIKRTPLFSAVRELYEGAESVERLTTDSRSVQLSLKRVNEEHAILATVDGKTFTLHSFWFLASDAGVRVKEFDRQVEELDFDPALLQRWRERMLGPPLTNEEIDQFHQAVRETPQEAASAIERELRKPESDVSVLVPRALAYYQHLLIEAGAPTIEKYSAQISEASIQRLLDWNFKRGLAQLLLVCGQPSITSRLDISGRSAAEVLDFFEWLESGGDRFSQIAGLEVGLRYLDRFPQIENCLLRICREIRDEDTSSGSGRLALTTGLFIFVDGELSRIGLFRNKPPFIRRLASIAQTAIIEREMLKVGVALDDVRGWAMQGRGPHFFMQSLADLRTEPRWLPDLMTNRQLRFEFLSRLRIAAEDAKDRLPAGELRDFLIGEGDGTLHAHFSLPECYISGPLEGGSAASVLFPEERLADLQRAVGEKVIQPEAFAAMVNFALVFRFDRDIALRIASVLKSVNYRVGTGSDLSLAFSLLAGLATIAAVSRTPELANELRVLTRILRQRGQLERNSSDSLRIALIASASREDLSAWSELVGDWLIELAYEQMDVDTARSIKLQLRLLCQVVPSLWPFASKADAALSAVVGSN